MQERPITIQCKLQLDRNRVHSKNESQIEDFNVKIVVPFNLTLKKFV